MKTNNIIILVVAFLLVAGGSFYGGMVYGKSQSSGVQFAAGNRTFQRTGGAGATGGNAALRVRSGANMTNGEVVSVDDDGVTLKLQDGGSKNVFFSASTTISQMKSITKEDLPEGSNVMVVGTENSDGSITAAMVQIRPEGSADVPGFGGMRPLMDVPANNR